MSDETRDALMRIDTHEKVYAERYGNIWEKLSSIETQFATVHQRFNTISTRMWLAVAGALLMFMLSRTSH